MQGPSGTKEGLRNPVTRYRVPLSTPAGTGYTGTPDQKTPEFLKEGPLLSVVLRRGRSEKWTPVRKVSSVVGRWCLSDAPPVSSLPRVPVIEVAERVEGPSRGALERRREGVEVRSERISFSTLVLPFSEPGVSGPDLGCTPRRTREDRGGRE